MVVVGVVGVVVVVVVVVVVAAVVVVVFVNTNASQYKDVPIGYFCKCDWSYKEGPLQHILV